MTLPNAGKPSLTDKIETIVTDIQENFAYLDITPPAFAVKLFSWSPGDGDGYSYITGVGFEPKAILFFAIGTYGEKSIGYYGPSTSFTNICFYSIRTLVSGSFSEEEWRSTPAYNSILWVINDASLNLIYGTVSSTNSDGFTFEWDERYAQLTGDAYYVIALCIK